MNDKRLQHTPRAGDSLELTIDTCDAEGVGVAQHQGRTYLVPGGLPSERVKARVEHVSKQRPITHAALLQVLTPHPARRRAPCTHHESRAQHGCSGCPLMVLPPTEQQAIKQAHMVALGIEPDRWVARDDAEVGYRWSSKRVAQGSAGRLSLGSYIRGSHRIADMQTCLVDHPRIRACVVELQRLANDLRIAGYDETTQRGDLRYVWLKTNGTDVLVTLIAAHAITPSLRTLAGQLTQASSVHAGVQSGTGNAIRAPQLEHLHGKPSLDVTFASTTMTLGPLGFLQPNPAVASLAYDDLCRDALGNEVRGALALDVYAGAGATTRELQTKHSRVIANDIDRESAQLLQVKPQDAATFLAAVAERGERPELVVCNPPRGGMGTAVCEQLVKLGAPRIHIMSCNPESLARDLAHLKAHYDVEGTRAYDTLPQTAHVEVVTWLTRKPNA